MTRHDLAVEMRICERLAWFGLHLDASRNLATTLGAEARITDDTSRLQAWVVAVDEAALMAEQTAGAIEHCARQRTEAELGA